MYAFETRNLTKKFGSKTVVDGVNLKVKKGHVFGFLGKNGAGKSTFINMITGVIKPTGGEFYLLNKEESNEGVAKKRIGVLPDYSTFYEDLSALEHLKYFSKLLGLKLPKEELIQLLEKVGLENAVNVKTKKFSFGMKKKLGLAQAIINNPDLLFLDEPTSGVDANAVLNIHSIIKKLAEEGKTIFLTSHNLNEVEKLCDEIAIMDKGVIQAQGSMEQLRSKYQSNIEVMIKHSKIPESHRATLKQIFESVGQNIEWSENHTVLYLPDEDSISTITRAFSQCKIDVLRVEVDEPSLEEIFLNLGNEKKTV